LVLDRPWQPPDPALEPVVRRRQGGWCTPALVDCRDVGGEERLV
jgi:hypothetical protein